MVLETLSPLERAVFVLKEAFGFSYPEIGEALGRSEQAARQLGHRALVGNPSMLSGLPPVMSASGRLDGAA
jgi:hypothetical protein